MPRYSHIQQVQRSVLDKPEWLRVKYSNGETHERIKAVLQRHNLHTVCEEAHCPNMADCWGGGTATFMLMGDTCTRGCSFCAVKSGNPHGRLDLFEPVKVAKAIAELSLKYVVLTSVNRDDLADGGANHFANTIQAIRRSDANVIVEVLIPDFLGDLTSVKKIVDARPEVVAHNVETTERLTSRVRDRRASYNQSLRVLKGIKELNPSVYSKSSIMLGLGETEDDLSRTVRDLREAEVDILTLGQYLCPSKGHISVEEYVSPDKFRYYQRMAEELGFLYVASGPFVRSSFKAGEFFLEAVIRRTKPESANSS